MAIDFPSSPSNGQTFTSGTRTWTWSSSLNVWQANNAVASNTASTTSYAKSLISTIVFSI